MLEAHMHLLTNAIVGVTYAVTIKGFEKEAKERAEAFRKAADAQVRTHTSVEELRGEVGAVKGEVAAMEQSLVERIGSLETRLIENLQSHDRSASVSIDTAALSERVAAAVAEEGAKIVELLGVQGAQGAGVTKNLFKAVVCEELLPKIQGEGKATREALLGAKQLVLEAIESKFSAVAAALASEGMKTRYSKERERPKNAAFRIFFSIIVNPLCSREFCHALVPIILFSNESVHFPGRTPFDILLFECTYLKGRDWRYSSTASGAGRESCPRPGGDAPRCLEATTL